MQGLYYWEKQILVNGQISDLLDPRAAGAVSAVRHETPMRSTAPLADQVPDQVLPSLQVCVQGL